ncbi:MAG: type II toxin-antitoxin system RelE/ParE family toxin [Bacteroidota bacterium]|nr:type II toxin-antitoxin system RelE/ParE family toxin [Bacteroidota bacterium]
MIASFGDKPTSSIWKGVPTSKLPFKIQHIARRKLRMINNSQNINDMRIPPSNHLEKLVGNYKGYHSIRINDSWRIIFEWKNGNAYSVQIVDYH